MTIKHRINLIVGLFAISASIVAIAALTWHPSRCPIDVRPETLEKLEIGMSENEVETILGGPSGDYSTRSDVEYMPFAFAMGPGPPIVGKHVPFTEKEWRTDEYLIHIFFTPDGGAVYIKRTRGFPIPPSMRYPPPLRQVMELFDP